VRLARPQPIHLYSGLVFLTGAAVIAALVISPSPVRISHAPVQFWIFAAVVMLGELLPVSIPRQDDDIQITVSTTFAFAILLAYGTTPAVLVFAAASVIGDMATRLAWYKVLLNLGQYALAMAACGLLLDATIGLGGGLSQFSTIQLLWVAVAGCVFFVVNVAALAAFLVLRHDAQFATVMRNEIPFHALITGSLLAIGPTVVVVAEHNRPWSRSSSSRPRSPTGPPSCRGRRSTSPFTTTSRACPTGPCSSAGSRPRWSTPACARARRR
jgi:hypothetical protein